MGSSPSTPLAVLPSCGATTAGRERGAGDAGLARCRAGSRRVTDTVTLCTTGIGEAFGAASGSEVPAGASRVAGTAGLWTDPISRTASPVLRDDPNSRIGAVARVPSARPDDTGPDGTGPDGSGPEEGAGAGAADVADGIAAGVGAEPGWALGGGPCPDAGPGRGPGVGPSPDAAPVVTRTVPSVLAVCDWVESQHQARHPICNCQMVCCEVTTAVAPVPSDPTTIRTIVVDCSASCTCWVPTQ